MLNKKADRILALFIAPIIGLVLGYFLAQVIENGWLSSSWQVVEQPPAHVRLLEAINGDSLWIRSDSGDIYYNEVASICASGCWRQVDKIPKLPILDRAFSVTYKACAAVPPLWGVVASISECRNEMWYQNNNTFALLNDGTIYLWQASVHGEWSAMVFMISPVFGAIALFVLTLFFVVISVFFDWLSNKANQSR